MSRKLNVLQVCDHLGWEGSRMHGVKRLFAWMIPRFDPERFTVERTAERHPFAYSPFGGGPRGCIGRHFALMEAQLALASVIQRYRIELVRGEEPELDPGLSLRPKGGMPIRLHERRP